MRNRFGFILVKPQLGENIGASARALKNFGFSNLSIVKPRDAWPNIKANATSVGAYEIIKKAKIFNNTSDAVEDFDLVFSTTARKRDINKKHLSFTQFLNLLNKKRNQRIGILFGPESSGLSNYDLSFSNYIIQIPTKKNFSSINLSHSVILICFEIFKLINLNKFKSERKSLKISSKRTINKLILHMNSLLDKRNFFSPQHKKKSMVLNINNLFHKLQLSDKDTRILASIISKLYKKN